MCTVSSSLLEAFSLYCTLPWTKKAQAIRLWLAGAGMFIYVDKIQELGQQPGQTPYVRVGRAGEGGSAERLHI